MEVMKWFVLGIAIVMYLLVIIFQEKKVLFTTCAAILIIVLGTIFTDKIFRIPDEVFALDSKFLTSTYALKHSLFHNINWNVIMIYLGCMMMATFFIYSKYFFKNFPVYDLSFFTICSGVPIPTTSPPLSPPSGPKSII